MIQNLVEYKTNVARNFPSKYINRIYLLDIVNSVYLSLVFFHVCFFVNNNLRSINVDKRWRKRRKFFPLTLYIYFTNSISSGLHSERIFN